VLHIFFCAEMYGASDIQPSQPSQPSQQSVKSMTCDEKSWDGRGKMGRSGEKWDGREKKGRSDGQTVAESNGTVAESNGTVANEVSPGKSCSVFNNLRAEWDGWDGWDGRKYTYAQFSGFARAPGL
jgi:hypothetical protein